MTYLKKFMLFSLTLFMLNSCSDDDPTSTPPKSLTQSVIDNSDLSILEDALIKADLVDILGSADFTVLAPTNAAFTQFLTDNNFTSLDDVPVSVLKEVLLNHVINGKVKSTDLVTLGKGYTSTNATGLSNNFISIYFDATNGVKFNNSAEVTSANITASNGVIHIVDKVISIPSIVDFVLADPDFSILLAALTRNDLTFDYVTTLSTENGTDPAPFTVFAPNDTAFISLLAELNVNALGDIDEPTLKATLDHHAVAGANVLSIGLMDDMTISTLGGNVTANVTGGATITDANDRVSNIIAVDIQGSNGVIHAIDKVILPPLQ